MTAEKLAEDKHSTLLDPQILEEVGQLKVLHEFGKSVAFKTLYSGEVEKRRQLIIFIRHYYCGQCEEYVRELAERWPPEKLASLDPPTELIVVGCGSPDNVPDYKLRTKAQYRIFSDPTRQIYFKLGFIENLAMGDKKPDYMKGSTFQSVFSSAWTALTAGKAIFTSGNFSQNGGEMLFENGQLKWFHRMKNTRDHAEISELEKQLHV